MIFLHCYAGMLEMLMTGSNVLISLWAFFAGAAFAAMPVAHSKLAKAIFSVSGWIFGIGATIFTVFEMMFLGGGASMNLALWLAVLTYFLVPFGIKLTALMLLLYAGRSFV